MAQACAAMRLVGGPGGATATEDKSADSLHPTTCETQLPGVHRAVASGHVAGLDALRRIGPTFPQQPHHHTITLNTNLSTNKHKGRAAEALNHSTIKKKLNPAEDSDPETLSLQCFSSLEAPFRYACSVFETSGRGLPVSFLGGGVFFDLCVFFLFNLKVFCDLYFGVF